MLREEQNLVSPIYIDIRLVFEFDDLLIIPNLFSTVLTKDGKMDLAPEKAFSIMSLTSYNSKKFLGVFQFSCQCAALQWQVYPRCLQAKIRRPPVICGDLVNTVT